MVNVDSLEMNTEFVVRVLLCDSECVCVCLCECVVDVCWFWDYMR